MLSLPYTQDKCGVVLTLSLWWECKKWRVWRVEVGQASSVGMATVVALGMAKGDWWEILKPLGAWGEVVTGWSEDWPLSEEVDSPDDSTPSSTSSSTGEGWEGRGVGT